MQPFFPFVSEHFLFIVGITAYASESILTMAVVTPMHGHDAALSCKLMHHREVVQVTWKKITLNSTENMATYSPRFGATITKPFLDHVQFLKAGLRMSSLLIKGVERDHQACYSCTFYSYPNGAVSSTACLKAYEINEPVTEVRETFSRDNRILHTLACSDRHASIFSGNVDNGNPSGSSVGHFDPSSDFSESVIKASVRDGMDLTCLVRHPHVLKREGVSTVKGEPEMMFLSNRSGRLSHSLSFVILVTGLCIIQHLIY